MNAQAINAVILGTLLKMHVGVEIAAMLGTRDVRVERQGLRLIVSGGSIKDLAENKARCFDAVKVLGAALKVKTWCFNGKVYNCRPVVLPCDPFQLVDHFEATLIVTYKETA